MMFGRVLLAPIVIAPKFVDSQNDNYNLILFSPAIDVGSSTVAELPVSDFNMNERVFDGNCDGLAVVDIGAFEFVESPVELPAAIQQLKTWDVSTINSMSHSIANFIKARHSKHYIGI